MPGQEKRRKGVRSKLNAMRSEFEGRNVLLIDDSIVRGTTSLEICSMAREAGAKKVYFASCSPPITHPHIYGIDLASSRELIAHERDRHSIAKHINADAVIYQTLPDLEAACAELSPRKNQVFEVGVFNGKYVTPVSDSYLQHLDGIRGDPASCASKAAVAGAGAPLPVNGSKVDVNQVDISTEEASAAFTPDVSNMSPPVVESQMVVGLHNLGDYPEN